MPTNVTVAIKQQVNTIPNSSDRYGAFQVPTPQQPCQSVRFGTFDWLQAGVRGVLF